MTQRQVFLSLVVVTILIFALIGIVLFFNLSFSGIAINPQPSETALPIETATIVPEITDTSEIAVILPTKILKTPTATPSQTPTETLTETPATYPDSFYLDNISGHHQVYSIGCEASAAVDWANYFGVSILEYTFQVDLPISDNPDFGFVGDVNSIWGQIPPYAYGVYSGPVADLLATYGLPARSVKNYTLDQVKAKLSESKPIIAWVIGNIEWSPSIEYTDSQGRTTLVAAFEHVVILTGYNKDSIRYMSNGKFYDTPTDVFLNSWSVLGNMAVISE